MRAIKEGDRGVDSGRKLPHPRPAVTRMRRKERSGVGFGRTERERERRGATGLRADGMEGKQDTARTRFHPRPSGV